MTARLGPRLLLLVGLQTALLGAIAADRQWLLETGYGVVLETVPVDPRSLFQGDYARMRYVVSRVALDDASEANGPLKVGDRVFVALAPDGDVWRAAGLSRDRDAVPPDHIAMRGTVTMVQRTCSANDALTCPAVELRYGIETYFVPEGTGHALERPAEDQTVTVEVAVDARGRAAIRTVLVNGRPWRTESLF